MRPLNLATRHLSIHRLSIHRLSIHRRGYALRVRFCVAITLLLSLSLNVFAEAKQEPLAKTTKSETSEQEMRHNEVATRDLIALLNTFTAFTTQFQQELKGRNGDMLQQLNGALLVDKPNRFRWNSLEPFPQEVVCDGNRIWIFDQDLDQVSVKPFDSEGASSPAMIFSGDTAVISSLYHINYENDAKGTTQTFKLLPREKTGLFEALTLTFVASIPSTMIMSDSLGQTTRITFKGFTPNPVITKDSFHFQAPKGVDVLYDE